MYNTADAQGNGDEMRSPIIFIIVIVSFFVFQKPALPQESIKSAEQIRKDSPFGIHPAVPSDEANNIGIKWTRGGAGPYLFWSLVDPNMTGDPAQFQWQDITGKNKNGRKGTVNYDNIYKLKEAGLGVLYNIEVEPRLGRHHKPGSWLPADEEAYSNFVKEVVKRYSFIEYWQIGNEPMVNEGLSDYGKFILLTYEAIKKTNPQAKVLIGGVAGMRMPQSISEYIANFNIAYLPLLEDIARLHKRCFDIFDFHWFGDAVDDYKRTKEIKTYILQRINELGIPAPEDFWITETGTYSGKPKQAMTIRGAVDWPYQSERQQAIDLVRRYIYPLSFGIKKVFWAWGLREGFHYDEGFFDFTGLIYDGKFAYDEGRGVRKLAYYTYKKMVEVLEGSDWNNIQTVQEKDGIYIYKFIKNNKPIWVAWNDNPQEKQIIISGITSSQVQITEAVPKYESGKEVTNYNTAFNIETKDVKDGVVIIALKENPVFVEAE
jgi:hypothetical protein